MSSVTIPRPNGTHTAPGAPSWLKALLPQHRADLEASGLGDRAIDDGGFASVDETAALRRLLAWGPGRIALGPCLVIPFRRPDGSPIPVEEFCRLKPDRPRRRKGGGGAVKYEQPAGKPLHAYFPSGTVAALSDPAIPLMLTEGEKKAAAADQAGFPCVGLTGVDCWTQGGEMIADLTAVAWHGRTVYVAYDSDATTKENVLRAEWRLAQALLNRGAVVRVVRLPPGEPGEDGGPRKQGLDDLLMAQGPDALRGLLSAATPPTEPPRRAPQVKEEIDDPHRLARIFIGERCRRGGSLTLRYWREDWHRWDGSAYRVLPERELRAELTASTKAEMDRASLAAQKLPGAEDCTALRVTGRLIADVAGALASLTVLPFRTEAPAWLDGEGPFPASEALACANGLLHLPSLVAGRHALHPSTPRYFSPNCLDIGFDVGAPRPSAWLEFLDGLWPGDPQTVATLAEWFGYCLLPDTTQQKILLLVGPKRSGKGTIARVLRGLIGAANVAAPTLASLGTNFGLAPLIGKTLAIVSDARLSGRTDVAVVTERLLSVSGEDAQTIDRKHLAPVTTTLPTRFVVLTNELPRLSDPSGALAGRMVLLRLTRSWYGREDTGLTARLLAELPAILLWAIHGWQRLRARGHFLQPDAGRDLLDDLEDLTGPVGAFVRDRCVIGAGRFADVGALYAAWKQWCADNGRDRPGTVQVFARDLLATVPTLGKAQPRDGDERYRGYNGIGLQDP